MVILKEPFKNMTELSYLSLSLGENRIFQNPEHIQTLSEGLKNLPKLTCFELKLPNEYLFQQLISSAIFSNFL